MADTDRRRQDVISLYRTLLQHWNARDAAGMARLFGPDGYAIGFDGSELLGPAEIESSLGQIFADHPTAAYVAKVRSVHSLAQDVMALRAAVGMVPPGKSELNPAVNAIQTLVAVNTDKSWRIAAFQNTPAAFHGRPERVEQMTKELQQVLRAGIVCDAQ